MSDIDKIAQRVSAKALTAYKLTREADLTGDSHEMLYWSLPSSRHMTDEMGLNRVGEIAMQDVMKLEKKADAEFWDRGNFWKMQSMTSVIGGGVKSYDMEIRLRSFDFEKLKKELKRLGFKVKGG